MDKKFMEERKFVEINAPTCQKYQAILDNDCKFFTQYIWSYVLFLFTETKNLSYRVAEMIKGQQGLIGEIVKSKSSNMGSKKGKPNQYKGLPLKYFEAMSYLERVCEWYTNVPFFLSSEVL